MNTAKVISLQSYTKTNTLVNDITQLFISALSDSNEVLTKTGRDYTRLVKKTFNVDSLFEITERQIKEFNTQSLINIIKEMNSANLSASAVNLLKCAVKKYFDVVLYVQNEKGIDLIKTNPASNTILTAHIKKNTKKGICTNTKELDFTAPQNILTLIEQSNESVFSKAQDVMVIKILRSTGIRVDELIQLKSTDIVEFNGNKLILVQKGKGNKSRVIDISDELYEEINAFSNKYRQHTEYLFLANNKPIRSTNTIRNMLNKYDAKIKPHDFRRMFASSLDSSGVSISDIGDLLGHSCDRTTKVYINRVNAMNKKINSGIVHI